MWFLILNPQESKTSSWHYSLENIKYFNVFGNHFGMFKKNQFENGNFCLWQKLPSKSDDNMQVQENRSATMLKQKERGRPLRI
jgi:hypothetical protein